MPINVTAGLLDTTNIWSIGMGDHPNAVSDEKFGHNDTVGTSMETVWSEGGIYTYLASATVLKISSSSGTDTGAASVRIIGLDANYEPLTEDKILTGQAEVTTSGEFLRVFRMFMLTAAAGEVENKGIIYAGTGAVSSGKPANVFCLIEATQNQSLVAFYTVKAGATALITGMNFGTAVKQVILELRIRELNSVFRTLFRIIFLDKTGSIHFSVPIMAPEKSDIELRAVADSPSADVSAAYGIVLIDN